FVVGWVFQFVGHYFEKKKPAFVDDVIGLAIGPLFVLAEFIFILGFRKPLHARILQEARSKREAMDISH
ncbi:MAG: Mpo1-like protein, partial [Pseudomonadota bacterium]